MLAKLSVGFVVGNACILAGMALEGGNLWALYYGTAMLIVVGGGFGALWMSHSLRDIRCAIELATGRCPHGMTGKKAMRIFSDAGNRVMLAGGVAFLLGLIHVMGNLSTVDRIGSGLAVAILGPLYGLLFRLFLSNPLRDACRGRGVKRVNLSKERKAPYLKAV